MNIPLTKDLKIRVQNSDNVFWIMKQVLLRENKIERDQEHVWVLSLNSQHVALNLELIGLGSLTKTVVEPMQVFRMSVHKGASGIIMIHNHPSGILEPSESDMDTTNRMIQVGRIIDIEFLDHLIISTEKYFSFEDENLMDELRLSPKYIPPYEFQEVLKSEAEKVGWKRGRKDGLAEGVQEGRSIGYRTGKEKGLEEGRLTERIEIARKMRNKGIDLLTIHDATGLSLKDIENL